MAIPPETQKNTEPKPKDAPPTEKYQVRTMILNDINFTKKGKDPDNDLENAKDRCGCGAVGIF